jgi:hypothetical protein
MVIRTVSSIVPTLCVGMQMWTLQRPVLMNAVAEKHIRTTPLERYRRHSHAERGNDEINTHN